MDVKVVTFDSALDALRKLCPNGDGAPEHSEQPPQWKACGRDDCEVCGPIHAIEQNDSTGLLVDLLEDLDVIAHLYGMWERAKRPYDAADAVKHLAEKVRARMTDRGRGCSG